jgi:hypothetical protein
LQYKIEAPMPCYYLHLHDGHDIALGPRGADFFNLATAQAEAVRVIRELWFAWPKGRSAMMIEIADATGQNVLRVRFADVVGPMQ